MSQSEKCCQDYLVRQKMLEKSKNYTIETVHGVKETVEVTSYPENVELDLKGQTLDEYVKNIIQWHHARNLIEGSSDKDQFCKLMQEAGELSDNICKGKDVADDIGDSFNVDTGYLALIHQPRFWKSRPSYNLSSRRYRGR